MSRLLLVVILVLGCKPRAGSSCEGDQQTCLDKTTRLVCVNGQYAAMPCKGERGCWKGPQKTNCDITGNSDGDACSPSERGLVACHGFKEQLVCLDGKFTAFKCLGKAGCQASTKCDDSIAELGSKCNSFSYACTPDSKQRLKCIDGVFLKTHDCRGPDKCEAFPPTIHCDLTVQRVGDRCEPDEEGRYACSEEGGQRLRCVKGKFALEQECAAGCRYEKIQRKFYCDQ
jgi:hypothetical protein